MKWQTRYVCVDESTKGGGIVVFWGSTEPTDKASRNLWGIAAAILEISQFRATKLTKPARQGYQCGVAGWGWWVQPPDSVGPVLFCAVWEYAGLRCSQRKNAPNSLQSKGTENKKKTHFLLAPGLWVPLMVLDIPSIVQTIPPKKRVFLRFPRRERALRPPSTQTLTMIGTRAVPIYAQPPSFPTEDTQ